MSSWLALLTLIPTWLQCSLCLSPNSPKNSPKIRPEPVHNWGTKWPWLMTKMLQTKASSTLIWHLPLPLIWSFIKHRIGYCSWKTKYIITFYLLLREIYNHIATEQMITAYLANSDCPPISSGKASPMTSNTVGATSQSAALWVISLNLSPPVMM